MLVTGCASNTCVLHVGEAIQVALAFGFVCVLNFHLFERHREGKRYCIHWCTPEMPVTDACNSQGWAGAELPCAGSRPAGAGGRDPGLGRG